MSRVYVPDALMAYERALATEVFAGRGHRACFARDPDVDAIATGGEPLTRALMSSFPGLRAVVRFARGRHPGDPEIEAARALGIAWSFAGGQTASASAEHALAMILALLHRLPRAIDAARAGRWSQAEIAEAGVHDLRGACVGQIGMGRIGRRLAALVRACGAHVIYHQPRRLAAAEESSLGIAWCELDRLVREADIVTLHARGPAHPILDAVHVQALKRGAVVVNVGDGRHVDMAALRDRIAASEILVGADVFPVEPWATPPLVAPDALWTPHIAGRSRAAARALFERVCDELDRALRTPPPPADDRAPLPPLLAALVARAPRALDRRAVEVSEHAASSMPALWPGLVALGAIPRTATDAGAFAELCLEPAGRVRVGLDLAAGCAATEITQLPTMVRLVERYPADAGVWRRLLADHRDTSFAGKRLRITGYSEPARLIAWRARQLGMIVEVADPKPLRQLDVLLDGFELAGADAEAPALVVDTAERDLGGELVVERTAAGLAVLCAAAAAPAAPPGDVLARADQLLADSVIGALT